MFIKGNWLKYIHKVCYSEVARKMKEETLSAPLCLEPQVIVLSEDSKGQNAATNLYTYICSWTHFSWLRENVDGFPRNQKKQGPVGEGE